MAVQYRWRGLSTLLYTIANCTILIVMPFLYLFYSLVNDLESNGFFLYSYELKIKF